MKFCTSCGAPLEFFEFLDGELCSNCLAQKKEVKPLPKKNNPSHNPNLNGLGEIELSVENGNIVMKSPEGWVLWTGSSTDRHQLQMALNKAQRIKNIREKRNRNNSQKGS